MEGYTEEQLQILVIMAHPADTFDHCGGTMCHHVERGDKVTVVGMYQGVHVHDEIIADKLRISGTTIRDKESEELRNARENVKNREVLDADAASLASQTLGLWESRQNQSDKRRYDLELAKIIREVKPDILITHYPIITLGMSPHCQAGEAVLRASYYADNLDFNNPVPLTAYHRYSSRCPTTTFAKPMC